MPIYEFKCKKCGKQFEVLVKSSDEKVKCKFCESQDVERLLSTFCARGTSSKSSSCPTGTCPLTSCPTCNL